MCAGSDIMSRIDDAMNYKNMGFNCTQAVLKAYSDLTGLDYEVLGKIGSGFGIGMGCLEATCGSLIGANVILGLLNDNPRKRTMTMSASMLNRFKDMAGHTQCKVLKGIETGKVLCPCIDCVKYACMSLEETLEEAGIKIDA